jgi:hypothetical protein
MRSAWVHSPTFFRYLPSTGPLHHQLLPYRWFDRHSGLRNTQPRERSSSRSPQRQLQCLRRVQQHLRRLSAAEYGHDGDPHAIHGYRCRKRYPSNCAGGHSDRHHNHLRDNYPAVDCFRLYVRQRRNRGQCDVHHQHHSARNHGPR